MARKWKISTKKLKCGKKGLTVYHSSTYVPPMQTPTASPNRTPGPIFTAGRESSHRILDEARRLARHATTCLGIRPSPKNPRGPTQAPREATEGAISLAGLGLRPVAPPTQSACGTASSQVDPWRAVPATLRASESSRRAFAESASLRGRPPSKTTRSAPDPQEEAPAAIHPSTSPRTSEGRR